MSLISPFGQENRQLLPFFFQTIVQNNIFYYIWDHVIFFYLKEINLKLHLENTIFMEIQQRNKHDLETIILIQIQKSRLEIVVLVQILKLIVK